MAQRFIRLSALSALCTLLYCVPAVTAATPTEAAAERRCCSSDRDDHVKLAQRNQAPAPTYRPPAPAYRPPANQNQPRTYQPQQFQQQRQQAQQQMRQRVEQQRVQMQQMQEQRRQQVAAQRARMTQERAELAKKNQEQLRRTQTQQLERASTQKSSPGALSGKVIGTAGLSVAALAAIPSHLQARLVNLTERTVPANDNPPRPATAGGGSRGGGDGTDGGGPGKTPLTGAFRTEASRQGGEGAQPVARLNPSLQQKIAALSGGDGNRPIPQHIRKPEESVGVFHRRIVTESFELKKDSYAFWGAIKSDPKATARIELRGDTLGVTYINRGGLPKQSGGVFLAHTIKMNNIPAWRKLTFDNIREPGTLDAHKSGKPASDSTLGRTAQAMADELGLKVKAMQFRHQDAKLHLDVEFQDKL